MEIQEGEGIEQCVGVLLGTVDDVKWGLWSHLDLGGVKGTVDGVCV